MAVIVYELSNTRLRQVYVGLTEQTLDKELARHRRTMPRELKAWLPPERQAIKIVEICEDARSARAYYKKHIAEKTRQGWIVVHE
jgi:hypothetical protein